ncbi:AMP-binding protein [Pseudofrankia saprophytica]|uniref:AMP-binding protein n=1 Tax=Pseudofrankia saprophytica TaxID=298655 RepID=UPI000234C47D|nr:AMP-binding protein [Pseudofrankia saprophytica]
MASGDTPEAITGARTDGRETGIDARNVDAQNIDARNIVLPPLHPFVAMDVPALLADRAARRGDHPFLVWDPPDGVGATWTYAEFAHDVEATAAGLAARGVGPGDAVILHLDNSPAFLHVWFACARLGAIAVDVNTRYVEDELAHAAGLVGAVGIVTDPRLGLADGPTAAGLRWRVLLDPATGLVPDLRGDPAALPVARPPDPATPLSVQLTSGTTARPKAVLYTHANALWAARTGAAHWKLRDDDRMLVFAPLFHTHALTWQMLPTLWVGGTVVLVPKFSTSRFWDTSIRNACTVTGLVGIMIQVLPRMPVPAEHTYRSWIFGLEMPELERLFGLRLFSAWGMTEVVTTVVIGEPDAPEPEPRTIGRPAPGYDVRIRLADGRDAAGGETGELRVGGVRGLSLFAGYLGDPAATAAAFDEDGYFRTGDEVTLLPSGAIRFSSRSKDMLKVSGENVAAAEIERVINTVPRVRESAVVARPDPVRQEVPVAFVTVTDAAGDDHDALAAEIVACCQASLADFKVPRAVHVVDALPRATLEKVAKATLRQWALERMTSTPAPPPTLPAAQEPAPAR